MKSSKSSGVFETKKKVFYVTETGVVFSVSWKRLGDTMEGKDPFPVKIVAGLPLNARSYFVTRRDDPNSRAVNAWIDSLETATSAWAAELGELLPRPPRPTDPRPVPSETALGLAEAAPMLSSVEMPTPRPIPSETAPGLAEAA